MRKGWSLVCVCAALQAWAGGVVIPIPVSAPSAGYVSLALIDTNGVLTRTLAGAEPVAAGTRTFFWDGATDLGLPAPPAQYTTRAIFFTNPPSARFVMKVGTSGNPPWRLRNATGDWGGDLGGPSAIVANSRSLMVVWSAVENNTLPGIQQVDTNGNVLWSYISFYAYDGRMAAAMDETNLFLGILNRDQERIEIGRYTLGTSNKTILAALPTPAHYTLSGRWKNRWQAMLDGLAITSDRIFASMAADDRLFILDRASGAILQQVTVPSPRGLAVAGNRLLVVSSNTVLKLTFAGAVEQTLVAGSPLDDPYAIAVDRAGNIYVSDGGSHRLDPEAITGNHQVHVFDTNGTYLRSLGAPGGSPRSGEFIREAFGDIRGLCIGPDDKLWVNEEITGFKRTSRWNTNGVIEREWFQRKLTHLSDLLNVARPSELIYVGRGFDDYPALTAYNVDWTNGTWSPAWSYAEPYSDMYQEDVYLSNDHTLPLQQYQPGKRYPVFEYNPSELVTYNGRNYFLDHEGNGDGAIFTYSATNKPQPVALVGYHRVDLITNRIVSTYDSGPNRWFTWADHDGDGRMSIKECLFTTTSTNLASTVRIYDATLETNLDIRLLRPVGGGTFVQSILPLKQVLPGGAPVYDWAMLRDVAVLQMPSFAGGDGWKTVNSVEYDWMPIVAGGETYALLEPTPEMPLDLPSLDHFWADRNWRKRIAKFDSATGRFVWAAGHRAPARALNGDMYNPFGLTVSHGAVFASDVLGMVWLWSQDGLYLGRLLNDAEPGQTWDEYAIHVEVQSPVTLYTNAAAGKLYMVINDTGSHVYEVTLPSVQPLPAQAVALPRTTATAVRAWDPDDHAPPAGSLISAQTSSNGFLLSWHTNAAAMTLQGQTAISAAWSNVIAARTTNGDSITVSLPRAAARQFFRLRE